MSKPASCDSEADLRVSFPLNIIKVILHCYMDQKK